MPDQTLITEFRNFLYSKKLEDQETMYKTIEGCLLLLKCLHEDITDKKYNLKQPSIDKIHGYVKSLELILSCFVVKKPSSGDKFSSREDSDLETLKQKTHQECFFLMQSLYEEITDKKNLLKQACNDVGLPTYSLVQQYSGRIDLF